uniref:Transmembrane protein n=1 Tax=Strongyloides stercoralis TaxID=6248 RepID=A0A0K0EHW9_STRER
MFFCFKNQKNIEKKPFAKIRVSTSSYNDVDIVEKQIENMKMTFFGNINILILLKFIALLIISCECLTVFLINEEFVMYAFVVFSISSLLFFCAIITAIQEENQKYIFTIMIMFYFKIILMILFIGIVVLSFYNSELIPYIHQYIIQDLIYSMIISTTVIFLTIIQIFLAMKVHKYFELRDELYTIPSVKVHHIRPEIAHVLTKNKY